MISIHALLAESDGLFSSVYLGYMKNFYPRSPCGERPLELEPVPNFRFISIHALLAESDESRQPSERPTRDFYPRSPCGERRQPRAQADRPPPFLSTLSLRRATARNTKSIFIFGLFLSTLSLRRATDNPNNSSRILLFLSTLSLRRATLLLSDL